MAPLLGGLVESGNSVCPVEAGTEKEGAIFIIELPVI
jgi:hypothetical protein